MAVFQSVMGPGSLVGAPPLNVVDPGIPLNQYDASDWAAGSYGPAWKNQPSVRKVVSFVARAIASTPLNVYERISDTDRQRVHDGPLAELLRLPSRAPALTPYRFWESVLIDGLLTDKWVVRIVERDDGWELVRIPAKLVSFEGDFLGRITGVVVAGPDGTTKRYDPEGFILDVGYSERGVNGTSPLRTLQDILAESSEAVAYRRSVWANGARAPQVIERPTPWPSEAAYERFRRSWENFRKGGGREGGTPILEDGMKLVSGADAFRPKDTLDLEGRKLTDVEVASAYHIAPELVGAREGTFSNVMAFKQMLYGPNLGPYIDAWQQTLNYALVPLLAGGRPLYIEANVESKLRGSFQEQAEVMSTAIGAPWLTRNEGRALQNLDSVEGGDELITPLNVLVGGQASPQDGKSLEGVLRKFADRQAQVVRSSKVFDRDRWDRELVTDLKALGVGPAEAEQLAFVVNDSAAALYGAGGNPNEEAAS